MKLKPAGKAIIALLVIGGAVGAYFIFGQKAIQDSAAVAQQEAAKSPTEAPVQTRKVEVTDEAGNTRLVEKKVRVYKVAHSEWPGHMAGIIACGGRATQPGSYCSKVTSGKIGDEPGIQLEFVVIETPDEKNAALQSGQVDFTWQVVDELPMNYPGFQRANVPAQAFVQVDWSRGGDACVASGDIKTPKDLVGRKSAMMKYSPDHTVFEFWINNAGLTAEEVGRIRQDTAFKPDDWTFARDLFCQGNVDVACLWEPDVTLALGCRPGAHRVFSTKDATKLVADVLLARKALLDAQPEVAIKVAKVFMEGAAIASADKSAAAKLVSSVMPRFMEPSQGGEMGYQKTLEAFEWVRWNTLGDNLEFFGLKGPAQFDVVYGQADTIWSQYMEPDGTPVLSQRFSPHMLRTSKIIEAIYVQAEQERQSLAARGERVPEAPAPEKVAYDPQVARTGKAKLTKPVSIHFDTGQFELDTGAKAILNREVLPQLRLAAGMSIRIEGNTDDTGAYATNKALSSRRAGSVVGFLVTSGVDRNRIASKGNGPDSPVCNLKTSDCRAQNRRTDIIFVSN